MSENLFSACSVCSALSAIPTCSVLQHLGVCLNRGKHGKRGIRGKEVFAQVCVPFECQNLGNFGQYTSVSSLLLKKTPNLRENLFSACSVCSALSAIPTCSVLQNRGNRGRRGQEFFAQVCLPFECQNFGGCQNRGKRGTH